MSENSKIEWTECTWNPVTGCTKISSGCQNCYAERMSKRLKAMGQSNYRNGFDVTLHPHALKIPLRWQQPRTIFVNSMSDLFHQKVSTKFIQKIFEVMRQTPQHQYQILTKRSGRLAKLNGKLDWPQNVYMGVTVEETKYSFRIDHLRQTSAVVKFLSLEPLLGPMPQLNLDGIDWIIVGGESGPGARPIAYEWPANIRDQCIEANIPFFFKQWGGVNKKKAGRLLDGQLWEQLPLAVH